MIAAQLEELKKMIAQLEALRKMIDQQYAAQTDALPDAKWADRQADRIEQRALADDLAIVRVIEIIKNLEALE